MKNKIHILIRYYQHDIKLLFVYIQSPLATIVLISMFRGYHAIFINPVSTSADCLVHTTKEYIAYIRHHLLQD